MCCYVSYYANVWVFSENGNILELINFNVSSCFCISRDQVTEGFLRLTCLPNILFLVMPIVFKLPKHGEIAHEMDGCTGDLSPVVILTSGLLLFSYLPRQRLLLS